MANPDSTYQGRPCKRGHNGIRYLSGGCVECDKLAAERHRRKKGMSVRDIHGYTSVGKNPHPLYPIWQAMISRCENPNNPHYRNYSAKGITVCGRWRKSFRNFLADVGERPDSSYSIDRIDGIGNYEPGNVKWSTRTEQGRNRPNFNKLTIEKARIIRILRARGFTYQELCNGFDVSPQIICQVVKGKTWKE